MRRSFISPDKSCSRTDYSFIYRKTHSLSICPKKAGSSGIVCSSPQRTVPAAAGPTALLVKKGTGQDAFLDYIHKKI